MWGNSVSFWSSIANLFLIIAFCSGIIAAIASFTSSIISGEANSRIRKETELETTKLKSVTERARAEAALANERAALLEKDSLQLRLDLVKESKANAPRMLDDEKIKELHALRNKFNEVILFFTQGTETNFLAMQYLTALEGAKIKTHLQKPLPSGAFSGIVLLLPAETNLQDESWIKLLTHGHILSQIASLSDFKEY